ncbi:hypothetical protein FPQ18DRAFT_310872 [Pyronema domesticum]|nr:hypothetical protein FPQ18DRAFT_310872 [Pyronema domesticum]
MVRTGKKVVHGGEESGKVRFGGSYGGIEAGFAEKSVKIYATGRFKRYVHLRQAVSRACLPPQQYNYISIFPLQVQTSGTSAKLLSLILFPQQRRPETLFYNTHLIIYHSGNSEMSIHGAWEDLPLKMTGYYSDDADMEADGGKVSKEYL